MGGRADDFGRFYSNGDLCNVKFWFDISFFFANLHAKRTNQYFFCAMAEWHSIEIEYSGFAHSIEYFNFFDLCSFRSRILKCIDSMTTSLTNVINL